MRVGDPSLPGITSGCEIGGAGGAGAAAGGTVDNAA
jgi:hypothetical protein